jgi:hypothetical protein
VDPVALLGEPYLCTFQSSRGTMLDYSTTRNSQGTKPDREERRRHYREGQKIKGDPPLQYSLER